MLDAVQSEIAASATVVAFRLRRDVVEVTGDDATTYLQGQLSQDVVSIPVGGSAWSLLLQPQGKVDTWLRLTRLDQDRWLCDTDPGAGTSMVTRLERFKLRTRISLQPLEWSMLALRGPGSERLAVPEGCVVADPAWPTIPGRDMLGPDPAVDGDVPEGDPVAYEVLRIRQGIPAMGSELTERTIPAEAGIVDRSVSFTKGCYVGQELVARIDSRGNNTPRRLLGLRLEGEALPPIGATVTADGGDAGEVTSVARSAVAGTVALAYLRRGIGPGALVEVAGDGSVNRAAVVALPFDTSDGSPGTSFDGEERSR